MKDFKYDYVVYIGRFQPPHLAHIQIIKQALEQSQYVFVLVGSANQPRTIRNPFTWQERETMIRASLSGKEDNRTIVLPLLDKMYNDTAWVEQVQSIVSKQTKNHGKVAIIGHSKDESSYYLEMFPQWDRIEVDNIADIHATDIRDLYFDVHQDEMDFDTQLKGVLPTGVHNFLEAFKMREDYAQLCREQSFITKYKEAWSLAPYPPTFVTVDTVVIQAGHVLLIRRRAEPGKNLWAISGGFVNQNERIEDAALRELKEETKIKVPIPVLRGNIKATFIADSPNRSLRGRTISHVFGIELPPGPLPKISKSGGDDADRARWIPLNVFNNMEDQMFEDHFHLVNKIIESLEH